MQRVAEVNNLAFFIVDEAHCISTWGKYFRQEYAQLGQLKQKFPVPFVALTGTASKMTIEVIRSQLLLDKPSIIKLSTRRSNLLYKVIEKPDCKATDFMINYLVEHHSGECGIVYCGTRDLSTKMAFHLKEKGVKSSYYHAGMDQTEKVANSKLWFDGIAKIMCCTSAFGMGIDKNDVRFVAHLSMLQSPEDLIQESGRAGRDGEPASCLVFYRFGDRSLHLQHISKVDNQAVQEEEINLLNKVTTMLADKVHSRQQLFALYFEEDEGEPCGICDNCQQTSVARDDQQDVSEITKDAINCLSQMLVLKPRVKASELVSTLIGSKAKDVTENRFNTCLLYGKGKLKFKTSKKLSRFIEFLIQQDIFRENFKSIKEGQYIVYLTCEKVYDILEGKRQVYYKQE